jgi:hypothetical protein
LGIGYAFPFWVVLSVDLSDWLIHNTKTHLYKNFLISIVYNEFLPKTAALGASAYNLAEGSKPL